MSFYRKSQLSKLGRGRPLRLLIVVLLIGLGLVTCWPIVFGYGEPDVFDGAVAVMSDEPSVNVHLQLEYDPPSTDSLADARDGTISIFPTWETDDQEAIKKSRYWFFVLTKDAQLKDAHIFNRFTSESRAVTSTRSEFGQVPYQMFQVELAHGEGIRGQPTHSLLTEFAGRYELAMPAVLTIETEVGDSRDGGVILGVQPWLALFAANPHLHSMTYDRNWYPPHSAQFMVSSGITQTSSVRVDRSRPEIDTTRWGPVVAWSSDHPFAASATLVDDRSSTHEDLLLALAFLFFGAALALLIETAFPERASEEPKSSPAPDRDIALDKGTYVQTAPAQQTPPPQLPQVKPTRNRNKGKPHRRKRKRR